MSLGCGLINCGKPPASNPGPARIPNATRSLSAGNNGDSEPTAVRPTSLPKSVLAARVDAQRRILGRGNLFEGIDGKPIKIAHALPPEGESPPDADLLDALPGSAGRLDETGRANTRVNGNELGLVVPIENPARQPGLAHFYEELRKLEQGVNEDGKVRILAYGASHTQSDIYTGYLRTYLQARFGNGGQGFIPFTKLNKWHKMLDHGIESKGWILEHAQRRKSRADGFFGLLGASISSSSRRDFSRIYPRNDDARVNASHFELAFLGQPDGGKLKLVIDGESKEIVDTASKIHTAGYHTIDLEPGLHSFEVRPLGNGEVRVFGMISERDEPGVVIDTLGISGTRAANMLKWDQELWTQAIRRRNPDLYMFAYGTNESNDTAQPIERYRTRLLGVLARFRDAVPKASCLIVGPGDVPRKLSDGSWGHRPRLDAIIDVQREVAFETECGFWDSREFMGGIGSMHLWATSRPQMASRDHIHFTRRGYVRLGMALADAMMAGYDR